MKTYYLCGKNRVKDKKLEKKLQQLIVDLAPLKVILDEDCSTSDMDFCWAYQFFEVDHDGERIQIVDYDLYEESGTVNGVNLTTGELGIIPEELL